MNKIIVILLLLPVSVLAQKGHIGNHRYSEEILEHVKSSYSHINIGSISEEAVRHYLINQGIISDERDIVLVALKTSLAGVHYAFRQLIAGVPVYHSQIKVNLDKSGHIRSLFDNSFAIDGLVSKDFPSTAITVGFIDKLPGMNRFTEESVYFSLDGAFHPRSINWVLFSFFNNPSC